MARVANRVRTCTMRQSCADAMVLAHVLRVRVGSQLLASAFFFVSPSSSACRPR